jgi:1,4-dihydroxy-2-naphthoyl-CoA hydrolase
LEPTFSLEKANDHSQGHLSDILGLEFLELSRQKIRSSMTITQKHRSPTGYLHAAAIIALADTTCGCGTNINLPQGTSGFTTLELKSNFLGTIREGELFCEAIPEHIGRTSQIWSATVTDGTGKRIALFRCSQIILYPDRGNLSLLVQSPIA